MHNLTKYNCDIVVANMLQSYRNECVLLTKDSKLELTKTGDTDLEKDIVHAVIRLLDF